MMFLVPKQGNSVLNLDGKIPIIQFVRNDTPHVVCTGPYEHIGRRLIFFGPIKLSGANTYLVTTEDRAFLDHQFIDSLELWLECAGPARWLTPQEHSEVHIAVQSS